MPGVRPSQLALPVLALLHGAAAIAVTEQQVEVGRSDRTYNVRLELHVDAPPHRVREILTDYQRLRRINPAIVASEVLVSPAPGTTRVRTHLRSCVWFLCRELEIVEDLHTDSHGDIRAEVVAELSDMKSGSAHWAIEGRGGGTRLTYESTMEPDFWVPPLIGPKAVRKSLQQQTLITAQNLQRLSDEATAEPPTP